VCDVSLILTGVMIASTVASGVTGYMGQMKAAKAQEQYQNQLVKDQSIYRNQVAEQANKSFIDQSYQANLRLQQEAEAAGDETFQRNQEAAQLRARTRTAAGEAGVSGLSVDNLLADYQRQQDYANMNTQTNLLFSKKQTAEDVKGMRADAISKVSGVRNYIPSPVQRPSLLSTIFDTTGKVAGIAMQTDLPGQIRRHRQPQ
jgi:hypothetical protein